MSRQSQRFSDVVRRLWSGRRTYTAEIERDRDLWRDKALRLERALEAIQAERVEDAKRVADAFAVSVTRQPIHRERTPLLEMEPIFEGPEQAIEKARAARAAYRQRYADANDLTIGEVNAMIRRGELSTDSLIS